MFLLRIFLYSILPTHNIVFFMLFFTLTPFMNSQVVRPEVTRLPQEWALSATPKGDRIEMKISINIEKVASKNNICLRKRYSAHQPHPFYASVESQLRTWYKGPT